MVKGELEIKSVNDFLALIYSYEEGDGLSKKVLTIQFFYAILYYELLSIYAMIGAREGCKRGEW